MVGLLHTTGALTLRQERLRMHRILSILEQLGDEAARQVLEDLARGAPEPELQKDAEQSLARLRRRNGNT